MPSYDSELRRLDTAREFGQRDYFADLAFIENLYINTNIHREDRAKLLRDAVRFPIFDQGIHGSGGIEDIEKFLNQLNFSSKTAFISSLSRAFGKRVSERLYQKFLSDFKRSLNRYLENYQPDSFFTVRESDQVEKMQQYTEEELRKEGLGEDMIKLLFKQNKVEEYKELLAIFNNPNLVAKILLMWLKEVGTKNNLGEERVEELVEDNLGNVLSLLVKKKISENQIKDVMDKLAKGESLEDAIKVEKIDLGDVEEKILKMIKSKPGLSEKAYMGLVMKEFGGKVSGKEVMGIIGKFVK